MFQVRTSGPKCGAENVESLEVSVEFGSHGRTEVSEGCGADDSLRSRRRRGLCSTIDRNPMIFRLNNQKESVQKCSAASACIVN